MKLLLLTALATVALAEPEAYYGYGGYYGHGLYGYGYSQNQWPSFRAPGFSSTLWGARGKRSAEPSAEPHGYGFYGYHPYAYGLYHPYVAPIAAPVGTGVGVHPGGATSYSHRSPQGLGKRSADEAAPAEDDKVYGSGHNSYVGQTVWGFPKVKRSAEEKEAGPAAEAAPAAAAAHVAVAHPYYGGYYGHQLGWASFRAPGFESTLWGGRGKRSAEAEAEPGYGYYGYPAYGYGYYGHQQAWPSIRAPGFSSQCFGCRGKRSAEAEAEPGYGYYGYPAYRGYYGYPYFGGVAGHPTGTSYSHRSPQGLGK